MPYAPKTWTTGETITAAELNALEQGLSNAASAGVSDSAVAAQVTSGTATGAALKAAYGSRATTRVYDEFSRYTDGALAGKTPLVGSAWQTTGSNPTSVAGGRATSTGTGYLYQTLTDPVSVAFCDVAFAGSDAAPIGTMTMAMCAAGDGTMLNNMIHFNFGSTGFNVAARRDAETPFPVLDGMSGNWHTPLPQDGATYARFWMIRHRDTITVIGPDGISHSCTDPRVGQLAGNTVFWEPNGGGTGGAQAFMRSCAAIATTSSGQINLPDLVTSLGAPQLLQANGAIAGNRGGYAQVSIGWDDTTGLPAIIFGAATITTRLRTAVAAGATTIITDEKIPNGSSVQIESGSAAETITTPGTSTGATAPFTTTVPALTKAHPVGSVVIATPPAGRQTKITYNPENQAFNVPSFVMNGAFYFNGQTVSLDQPSSGVLEVFGLGTGKGAFRPGVTTTAGRPSPSAVGLAIMIDSDLGKLIVSNGTTWSVLG